MINDAACGSLPARVETLESSQATLRQRYAMAALTGLLADPQFNHDPRFYAQQAFTMADAMLAAEQKS